MLFLVHYIISLCFKFISITNNIHIIILYYSKGLGLHILCDSSVMIIFYFSFVVLVKPAFQYLLKFK